MMLVLICFAWTMPLALQEAWGDEPKLRKGQTIYLPIYSNIMVGEKKKISFNLSVNVSIRNTDPNHPITIMTADYYDSEGNLVRRYIESPKTLGPMASSYHYISQSDAAGGWGANFIIKWKSDTEVNQPIIESVTYGSRGTHSISFITRGQSIK
jgi:hypothetical protein